MVTVNWKDIGSRGTQLPAASVSCHFEHCVCMYSPIQGAACDVEYMHVYEECGWTCWIGLSFCFVTQKTEEGEASVGQVVYSLEMTWSGCRLHWKSLSPDMSVLHDWQIWLKKIFAWRKPWPHMKVLHVLTHFPICPPLPTALCFLLPLLLFLWSFFPRCCHCLFGCCFYLQIFSFLSMKRQILVHSCIGNNASIASKYPEL